MEIKLELGTEKASKAAMAIAAASDFDRILSWKDRKRQRQLRKSAIFASCAVLQHMCCFSNQDTVSQLSDLCNCLAKSRK